MKRICLILIVFFLTVFPSAFADDRDASSFAQYTSNTLIKRGDWTIYRISFKATASNGFFTIYDCLTLADTTTTNAKTEGSEAWAENGKNLSFVGKPLEGSTGLFLEISNASVLIEYK